MHKHHPAGCNQPLCTPSVIFTSYDSDGSLAIDQVIAVSATGGDVSFLICFVELVQGEFNVLFEHLSNGGVSFKGNSRQAMKDMDLNHDGVIHFHEFLNFHEKTNLFVFPLIRFRHLLQEIMST